MRKTKKPANFMHDIIIQNATNEALKPSATKLKNWARVALEAEKAEKCEVTIRVVEDHEIQALNKVYRKKDYATNVLSFPVNEKLDDTDVLLLGDIVIGASVVNKEALTQSKKQEAHWAHMVVHGILHLLGYDHEIEKEATIMEAREIAILKSLHFNNPYEDGDK